MIVDVEQMINKLISAGETTETTTTINPEGEIQHYKGTDFIIVDSLGSVKWKFRQARKYCQNVFGTDLYSINTFNKQCEVLKLSMDKGVTSKGWIGLSDELEEGNWGWVNGEETNSFFYWKEGVLPIIDDENENNSLIRFDSFGGGWDPSPSWRKAKVIVCSRR